MATYELAKKYSGKVDEKFSREALVNYVTNRDYDWTGADTVKVYSVPVVENHNYSRSGSNRYGTPDELGNSAQTLAIRRDRGWTFTIDRLNKTQSMMVNDAGKAISRQMSLKTIPEVDSYTFGQMAAGAGSCDDTAATTSNAYSLFLAAQEALGDANVPDRGRVCLCSYKFAGLLKQDAAFMRDCDLAQNMQLSGHFAEIDGCKLIKVPASRLPKGCQFILCHPTATVAPSILSEYKIHTDAPGISGWLCEGRFSYDAFVLDNKKDAIYYSGPFSASLQTLCLNKGESTWVDAVNYSGTVTAAVTTAAGVTSTALTATVSSGKVTIAADSAATAGDYKVTLTNSSDTVAIAVKVV